MGETVKKADPSAIVAECWTCACDGPPVCTMPHDPEQAGSVPYALTEYRMRLHTGHDVRPVKVTR